MDARKLLASKSVSLVDPNHQPIDHFKVSTSYALGGLAGGQDEARMGWLYEKFAEKTWLNCSRIDAWEQAPSAPHLEDRTTGRRLVVFPV